MAEPKILIIDDEEEMRWVLAKAMEQEGFIPVTAGGGREGLELFFNEKPAAVLVDLKMPDMDGLEVVRRVRQVDAQVPLILITGHGSIDVASAAISKGATGYIIKPFSVAELRATVKRMVVNKEDE
ncbi:MAG: response regulator [Peptococcaceae bacterium]|nr:response regulator [Peptococcaceae bacterium]